MAETMAEKLDRIVERLKLVGEWMEEEGIGMGDECDGILLREAVQVITDLRAKINV